MDVRFTDKQLAAINHNDGNIVVSASAGSGKTKVMVERLIRLISEDRADVKDILAVTFTKLAAGEIKERLGKALIGRIREGKDIKRLKKQLSDLPMASISTIDSFLNSLLRKYFYLADVDPSFSIVADAEEITLKNSAISEVFERLYDANDEDLNNLLNVFLKKRNDENLKKIILGLYGFLESETDGDLFLRNAADAYTEEGLKTIDNRLIGRFVEKIGLYSDDIDELINRASSLQIVKYVTFLSLLKRYVCDVLGNKDLDGLLKFASFKEKRPVIQPKDDDAKRELQNDVKDLCDSFKKISEDISKFFYADFNDRVKDLQGPARIMKSLIKVVGLFREEYSLQKREKNVLDYSDVSHVAYKLLQTDEVKEDLKASYKYIFVDEYQDTNGIQESIFRLLENNNLFLVGDVKQSIYGFRGCFSENFSARIDESQSQGAHIELDANFRSSKAVVDTVNKIFADTMTKKTMGFDYKKSPMVYGELYGDYAGETKLFYYSGDEEKDKLDVGVYSIEKHLAHEQKQKINYEKLVVYAVKQARGMQIYDLKKNELRSATYEDIAVLNRTVKSGVDKVVKELEAAGIPTVSENKRSIETYPEIQLLVNILECLVMPDNDIALAATLKSSIGNLSDLELKKIRDNCPSGSFYQAAVKYSQTDDSTGKKIAEFFAYLRRIRLLSAFEGVPTLLRRIMREKSLTAQFIGSEGGEYKLGRIEVFISQGYKGSKEMFVDEFLENISDALSSMTAPSVGGGEAVSVISMHGSKGLEFPIVIVAGVDRNWNAIDSREEISLSRNVGVGLKVYDENTKVAKNSVVKEYVGLLKREENLKEELRLLYVALTRAQSALYVVAKKAPQEQMKKDIFECKKQLDLMCLKHFDCEEVYFSDLAYCGETKEKRPLVLPQSNETAEKEIKKYLDFSYPYKDDTLLSVKRTVTEISKSAPEKDFSETEYVKPIFSGSDVETGNAYHKFLELLDFSKINDNGLIDRLFDENFTEDEKNIIDIEKVKRILELGIFEEIKDYKLYKEQPFIVTIPPSFAGESGEENLLLQGVIDLLCVNGDQTIIVDYKHSNKKKEDLVNTYRKQLELYRYAVEKALNKKVVKKVLVNLMRVEQIEL